MDKTRKSFTEANSKLSRSIKITDLIGRAEKFTENKVKQDAKVSDEKKTHDGVPTSGLIRESKNVPGIRDTSDFINSKIIARYDSKLVRTKLFLDHRGTEKNLDSTIQNSGKCCFLTAQRSTSPPNISAEVKEKIFHKSSGLTYTTNATFSPHDQRAYLRIKNAPQISSEQTYRIPSRSLGPSGSTPSPPISPPHEKQQSPTINVNAKPQHLSSEKNPHTTCRYLRPSRLAAIPPPLVAYNIASPISHSAAEDVPQNLSLEQNPFTIYRNKRRSLGARPRALYVQYETSNQETHQPFEVKSQELSSAPPSSTIPSRRTVEAIQQHLPSERPRSQPQTPPLSTIPPLSVLPPLPPAQPPSSLAPPLPPKPPLPSVPHKNEKPTSHCSKEDKPQHLSSEPTSVNACRYIHLNRLPPPLPQSKPDEPSKPISYSSKEHISEKPSSAHSHLSVPLPPALPYETVKSIPDCSVKAKPQQLLTDKHTVRTNVQTNSTSKYAEKILMTSSRVLESSSLAPPLTSVPYKRCKLISHTSEEDKPQHLSSEPSSLNACRYIHLSRLPPPPPQSESGEKSKPISHSSEEHKSEEPSLVHSHSSVPLPPAIAQETIKIIPNRSVEAKPQQLIPDKHTTIHKVPTNSKSQYAEKIPMTASRVLESFSLAPPPSLPCVPHKRRKLIARSSEEDTPQHLSSEPTLVNARRYTHISRLPPPPPQSEPDEKSKPVSHSSEEHIPEEPPLGHSHTSAPLPPAIPYETVKSIPDCSVKAKPQQLLTDKHTVRNKVPTNPTSTYSEKIPMTSCRVLKNSSLAPPPPPLPSVPHKRSKLISHTSEEDTPQHLSSGKYTRSYTAPTNLLSQFKKPTSLTACRYIYFSYWPQPPFQSEPDEKSKPISHSSKEHISEKSSLVHSHSLVLLPPAIPHKAIKLIPDRSVEAKPQQFVTDKHTVLNKVPTNSTSKYAEKILMTSSRVLESSSLAPPLTSVPYKRCKLISHTSEEDKPQHLSSEPSSLNACRYIYLSRLPPPPPQSESGEKSKPISHSSEEHKSEEPSLVHSHSSVPLPPAIAQKTIKIIPNRSVEAKPQQLIPDKHAVLNKVPTNSKSQYAEKIPMTASRVLESFSLAPPPSLPCVPHKRRKLIARSSEEDTPQHRLPPPPLQSEPDEKSKPLSHSSEEHIPEEPPLGHSHTSAPLPPAIPYETVKSISDPTAKAKPQQFVTDKHTVRNNVPTNPTSKYSEKIPMTSCRVLKNSSLAPPPPPLPSVPHKRSKLVSHTSEEDTPQHLSSGKYTRSYTAPTNLLSQFKKPTSLTACRYIYFSYWPQPPFQSEPDEKSKPISHSSKEHISEKPSLAIPHKAIKLIPDRSVEAKPQQFVTDKHTVLNKVPTNSTSKYAEKIPTTSGRVLESSSLAPPPPSLPSVPSKIGKLISHISEEDKPQQLSSEPSSLNACRYIHLSCLPPPPPQSKPNEKSKPVSHSSKEHISDKPSLGRSHTSAPLPPAIPYEAVRLISGRSVQVKPQQRITDKHAVLNKIPTNSKSQYAAKIPMTSGRVLECSSLAPPLPSLPSVPYEIGKLISHNSEEDKPQHISTELTSLIACRYIHLSRLPVPPPPSAPCATSEPISHRTAKARPQLCPGPARSIPPLSSSLSDEKAQLTSHRTMEAKSKPLRSGLSSSLPVPPISASNALAMQTSHRSEEVRSKHLSSEKISLTTCCNSEPCQSPCLPVLHQTSKRVFQRTAKAKPKKLSVAPPPPSVTCATSNPGSNRAVHIFSSEHISLTTCCNSEASCTSQAILPSAQYKTLQSRSHQTAKSRTQQLSSGSSCSSSIPPSSVAYSSSKPKSQLASQLSPIHCAESCNYLSPQIGTHSSMVLPLKNQDNPVCGQVPINRDPKFCGQLINLKKVPDATAIKTILERTKMKLQINEKKPRPCSRKANIKKLQRMQLIPKKPIRNWNPIKLSRSIGDFKIPKIKRPDCPTDEPSTSNCKNSKIITDNVSLILNLRDMSHLFSSPIRTKHSNESHHITKVLGDPEIAVKKMRSMYLRKK
ncbi:titin-like isoform X2 [Teleopsis dalmanni]|uniref:titin-like isoform X2 n=1 Tax=Teleopsis dalmanni TaxID=139649 RepID=UPI0018CFC032|nr:titin-like isoform X2 [Teleopsis dalmanni]